MMKQAFFVTGTDTNVGKTYIACKLIQQYVAQGFKVVGMKPVAAGCDWVDGEWVNDDVLKLEAASNVKAPRSLTNPYSFKAPIAPHIAAEQDGIVIEISVIKQAYDELNKLADIVIVEGAGGLLVPLDADKTILDLMQELQIPVVLVVGMKLGCINHTLLTIEAIQQRQLILDAWVANSMDLNMQARLENLKFLQEKLINIKQIEL
jgi:dethiobiotin synthetase